MYKTGQEINIKAIQSNKYKKQAICLIGLIIYHLAILIYVVNS